MTALYFLLQQSVIAFAAWTLGYHLCLALSLPAIAILAPASVFLILLEIACGISPKRALASARKDPAFVSGTLLTGFVMAVFTLFVYRPDADDISFFHRALVQLDNLRVPFILTNTQHNVAGLPPISIFHVMTSYEPLVALLGKALVGNPLWFYQHAGAVVAAFLMPSVYVLLFRRLRFSRWRAVCATVLVIVFLLLDRTAHRTFGNYSFTRLWQGKAIMVTVLVPMTCLLSLRFLSRPSLRRLGMLILLAVAATGLSSSSLFLIPVLIAGISIAYLAALAGNWRKRLRCVLLNAGSAYCVLLIALLLAGILPKPADTQAWESWQWGAWWQVLKLVPGTTRSAVRDMLLLLIPWITLGPFWRRFIFMMSVSFALIFANPLTGPAMMYTVMPGAYFRLAFLFPVPLCFGSIVSGIPSGRPSWRWLVRAATSILAVVAVLWSLEPGAIEKRTVKNPFAPKFPETELSFCRRINPRLENGARILAPQDVVWVLGLLRPDVRFETCRATDTLHAFRCAGRESEGADRASAQKVISAVRMLPRDEEGFLRCLSDDFDYIVATRKRLPVLYRLLETARTDHEILAEDYPYVLLRVKRPMK